MYLPVPFIIVFTRKPSCHDYHPLTLLDVPDFDQYTESVGKEILINQGATEDEIDQCSPSKLRERGASSAEDHFDRGYLL